jgi:D-alanyl-D-alanine carboxypeptidase
MSRKLDDLVPELRVKAFELIARCAELRVPIFIVDTLRTPQEQEIYLAKGVSWTPRSKHLVGRAIDVCPYQQFALHETVKLEWNADDPAWQTIGRIGKQLGLVWGGDWRHRDLSHFELPDEVPRSA